jgi:hypothetical protein
MFNEWSLSRHLEFTNQALVLVAPLFIVARIPREAMMLNP